MSHIHHTVFLSFLNSRSLFTEKTSHGQDHFGFKQLATVYISLVYLKFCVESIALLS